MKIKQYNTALNVEREDADFRQKYLSGEVEEWFTINAIINEYLNQNRLTPAGRI